MPANSPELSQELSPRDERLQYRVAKRRVQVDDLAHPARPNLVDLAVPSRHGAHQGRFAGQMCNVPREVSRAVNRDGLGHIPRVIDNLDLARLDDEKPEVAVTHLKQAFSVAKALEHRRAAAFEARHLFIRQLWKRDGVEVMRDHRQIPGRRLAGSFAWSFLRSRQHQRLSKFHNISNPVRIDDLESRHKPALLPKV